MTPFRPKKKIGQIFINIPGDGSFAVEATGDPASLNAALLAASEAFWNVYKPGAAAPDPRRSSGGEA